MIISKMTSWPQAACTKQQLHDFAVCNPLDPPPPQTGGGSIIGLLCPSLPALRCSQLPGDCRSVFSPRLISSSLSQTYICMPQHYCLSCITSCPAFPPSLLRQQDPTLQRFAPVLCQWHEPTEDSQGDRTPLAPSLILIQESRIRCVTHLHQLPSCQFWSPCPAHQAQCCHLQSITQAAEVCSGLASARACSITGAEQSHIRTSSLRAPQLLVSDAETDKSQP